MNAFDAVEEQIARRQLADREYSAEYRSRLAETYWVRLHLDCNASGLILTCRDNGVGMSKQIIEKFLLVSGQDMNPQLSDLQLACSDHGVTMHRSGEFGIGVLSYFMLADHIRFETFRLQETNGEPHQGWEFETWGVGSFGELRKCNRIEAGTTVTLKLRQKKGSEGSFFSRASTYLKELIRVAPCRFQFTTNVTGQELMAFRPGWILSEKELVELSLKGQLRGFGTHSEQLTSGRAQFNDERERVITESAEVSIVRCMQWFEGESGELSGGLGRYRILIPFFELNSGKSLIYPAPRQHPDDFVGLMFRHKNAWYPESSLNLSWRGWAIREEDPNELGEDIGRIPFAMLQDPPFLEAPTHFHVNVDLQASDVGRVEVHRRSMKLDPVKRSVIVRELNAACSRSANRFLDQMRSPSWEYVNRRVLGRREVGFHSKRWLALWEDGTLNYRDLSFPVAARWDTSSEFSITDVPLWRGTRMANPMELGPRLTWYSKSDPPQKLALLKAPSRARLCVVWEHNPSEANMIFEQGWALECPPSWRNLLGGDVDRYGSPLAHARGDVMRFINRDHVLFDLVSDLPIVEVSGQGNRYNTRSWSVPPDTVLTDRRTAAGWLLEAAVLERDFHVRYWKMVEEAKPGFLLSLWSLLFGEADQTTEVLFAQENVIKTISAHQVRYAWLPSGLDDPGDEWVVTTETRHLTGIR